MRVIAGAALLLSSAGATPQPYQPPRHTQPPPMIAVGTPLDINLRADAGTQIERDRAPAGELEEHRKLDRALHALAPQRAGTVDAYVVSIALDSDPVFGREARVAGDVLARRYGAAGRVIVLAGTDGSGPSALPRGTPETLGIALARIAELIDRREDVLVLYTTGHGTPVGLYYNDGDSGYGLISPNRLAVMLEQLGISNRLLILSACYSGVFLPRLQTASSVVVTAAARDRSSFGCVAENDWTFFGDALINHALRRPQPLPAAFAEASNLLTGWEARLRSMPSNPQYYAGPQSAGWLAALDRRMPAVATAPVGRPAVDSTLAAGPVGKSASPKPR
ncbi:MAG TPA: C13 family peptidase [Allosphingosinicella sp.]|nr:C13 family peptidase [Allosphingosinicella sp.]